MNMGAYREGIHTEAIIATIEHTILYTSHQHQIHRYYNPLAPKDHERQ